VKPSLSISACWNSSRHEDGYAMLSELAEMGFESVELGHGIRYSLWPGILKAHEEKLIRIQSLHNFCPLPMGFTRAAPNCYEFSHPKSIQRTHALKYTLQTIDHAAMFGARAVVLHLGTTEQKQVSNQIEALYTQGKLGSRAYVKLKVQAVIDHERWLKIQWPWVEEVLHQLIAHASAKNIKLGLECRESIEEIPIDSAWPQIFAALPQTAGYWHDFGHAARKHTLGFIDHYQHLSSLAPRLIGCHIHDLVHPHRDHQVPGTGSIPFEQLWPLIEKCASLTQDPCYVLELSPRVAKDKVLQSLLWWKQNGPASLQH
jgi:sugar phosphate isomerase/epimerase